MERKKIKILKIISFDVEYTEDWQLDIIKEEILESNSLVSITGTKHSCEKNNIKLELINNNTNQY